MYGVGIVVSVLICTIIWNGKFVSMNYISNEIYEKNIKLTEDMYRPTFDRKLDKYLDLFAIRKPCEVTGEIVNVYFHPFNDNGKPMLKFNGCGMRSYCKECDLCADRAFDTVEKLNRKETTFEKTGAFSVKQ